MMDILNFLATKISSFLLVLLQGIFEAFPLSSSMHINLLSNKLGLNLSKNDNALMHFGTSLAFFFLLLPFIIFLFKNVFQKFEWKIVAKFALMLIPSIIIGFYLRKIDIKENPYANIIAAVTMLIADFCARKKSISSLNFWTSFAIGNFITLAFIPGVSRLGVTFTILRFFQLRRVDALVTSLLIGIPLTLGAAALCASSYTTATFPWSILIQSILSGAVTYFCLKITFKFLNYWWVYGIYRIMLSVFLIMFK